MLPGHGRQLADPLVRDLGVVGEVELCQQGEPGEEGQPSVRHRVASGQRELAQPQTWGCGFISIFYTPSCTLRPQILFPFLALANSVLLLLSS